MIVNIRTADVRDLPTVVFIHQRSFKGFFLTFLGPSFLNTLYKATLLDASGIAIVSESNGRVTGFVTGTTQPAGFYTRLLKKHLLAFAWGSLKGFLKKPGILPRLLRAFSMPKQELPKSNCATLMSIGVDPNLQGQGTGKLLATAFLDVARSKGSEYVNLTTDAVDNEGANHFYRSLGFELESEYTTPEGRVMNEYLIKL
jgi:ribosomal protein S18 acetylase RimI-like enzyme